MNLREHRWAACRHCIHASCSTGHLACRHARRSHTAASVAAVALEHWGPVGTRTGSRQLLPRRCAGRRGAFSWRVPAGAPLGARTYRHGHDGGRTGRAGRDHASGRTGRRDPPQARCDRDRQRGDHPGHVHRAAVHHVPDGCGFAGADGACGSCLRPRAGRRHPWHGGTGALRPAIRTPAGRQSQRQRRGRRRVRMAWLVFRLHGHLCLGCCVRRACRGVHLLHRAA